MRIRPFVTLDKRQRSAATLRVRASNVKGVSSLRIVSTTTNAPLQLNNASAGPQLANQVVFDGTAAQ